MIVPPLELDGAKVLKYAYLQDDVQNTGEVYHCVNGQEVTSVVALAICRYEKEEDIYIFYCDSQWNVLTDLCRETMDTALSQAEFEYKGISKYWKECTTSG